MLVSTALELMPTSREMLSAVAVSGLASCLGVLTRSLNAYRFLERDPGTRILLWFGDGPSSRSSLLKMPDREALSIFTTGLPWVILDSPTVCIHGQHLAVVQAVLQRMAI